MSRIGKQPVTIPKGVEFKIENRKVSCKGPKGSLTISLPDNIEVKADATTCVITRANDEKNVKALHGTIRAILANMVEGVTVGFSQNLEIVGVGYKAILKGQSIALDVGFANTITVAIPAGVKVEVPDPTKIKISGPDKHLVGQTAAAIRAVRKPEPYKGKGIRYVNEVIRRKAGKAAAGATAKK